MQYVKIMGKGKPYNVYDAPNGKATTRYHPEHWWRGPYVSVHVSPRTVESEAGTKSVYPYDMHEAVTLFVPRSGKVEEFTPGTQIYEEFIEVNAITAEGENHLIIIGPGCMMAIVDSVSGQYLEKYGKFR